MSATQSGAELKGKSRGRPAIPDAVAFAWRRWFNARDPFAVTRWRLLAWNVLVLTIIVLVVGTLVYLSVQRARSQEVDEQLQMAALGQRVRLDGRERFEREAYFAQAPDIFFVVSDTSGRVLIDPRASMVSGFPVASNLRTALGGQPSYATVALGGVTFRVYSTPLIDHGQIVGAVQAAKSLAPQERELRDLLIIMLFGGLASIVLITAGGLILVELALVPVRRAFDRQRQFVADASHELRTPIALIKATAEVLARDPDKPIRDNADLVTDIERETDHLGRLINDLLQLARLDSGQLKAELGPVALSEVVQEAVEQVKRLAPARNRDLAITAQPNVWVRGDLGRLRQVLLILLDNAVKHTPSGGRVDVTLENVHGWTRLAVTDTGEGIPSEHLPFIFDRFYRVDKARSRADGGVGLGLAIAKELVEIQGGRISVDSAPGRGSTFAIWLPTSRPASHKL